MPFMLHCNIRAPLEKGKQIRQTGAIRCLESK